MKKHIYSLVVASVLVLSGCGNSGSDNGASTPEVIPEDAIGVYVDVTGNPERTADGETTKTAISKGDYVFHRDTVITDADDTVKMVLVNETAITVGVSSEFYIKDVAAYEETESTVITASDKNVMTSTESGIPAMRFSGEIKGAIHVEDNVNTDGIITSALKDAVKTATGIIGRIVTNNECKNFKKTFAIGIRGTTFDVYGGTCEVPPMISVTDGGIDVNAMYFDAVSYYNDLNSDSVLTTTLDDYYREETTTYAVNVGEVVLVDTYGQVSKALLSNTSYGSVLNEAFTVPSSSSSGSDSSNTITFDSQLHYTSGQNADNGWVQTYEYEVPNVGHGISIHYNNLDQNVSFYVEGLVSSTGDFSITGDHPVSGHTSGQADGVISLTANGQSFQGTLSKTNFNTPALEYVSELAYEYCANLSGTEYSQCYDTFNTDHPISVYTLQYSGDWIDIDVTDYRNDIRMNFDTVIDSGGNFFYITSRGYIVSGNTSPNLGDSISISVTDPDNHTFNLNGTLVQN